jgi:hypothetical protein
MIKYETWQMKDNQGFEQTNTSGEIIILKEFFEDLYSRFLRIDFREIILQNTNIFGLDGFSIEVSIGTAIHDIVLHLWSPKFNPIQRGTQEINGLLMEVFDLVNLLDYY